MQFSKKYDLWKTLQVLFVSSLVAVISLNCFQEPLSPLAPTWDTNLTLPLANRLFTVSEIISKDTTLLKTSGGNQISVSKSVTIPPAFVSDKLSLSPKDTSVAMQVGAFTVNAPDQRTPINIDWLPQGQTIPVPDTSFAFTDIRAKIAAFENITLKSGMITLTVQNNLPIAMDIRSPIQLLDLNGNIVATFVFSPATIPARSARSASDNLASKTVESDYRITGLQFHTPGSRTPVTIPTGELLVTTLSTTNLKATRASLANIPAQRLADNDTAKLRLDDSTMVRELYMRSGSLRFSFTSNVSLGMTFKFRFAELQRRMGASYIPYEDSLYLGPNGTGSMLLNLANTRIKSQSGNLISALSVLSTVAIFATQGTPVTVSETDRVSIAVTKNSTVIVDSAVGVIKPTWVNVDTRVGLNLGAFGKKFSGQLNIPAASLSMNTLMSIGFPADMYIKIGAQRSAAGDSVFMNVPVNQRRLVPGQGEIRFDGAEVGRFLSQISGKLPDSLRIVGKILVNPADVYTPGNAGVGTVGSNSSISGVVNLNVPLNLGIVTGDVRDTLAIGDTTGDGHKSFTFNREQTKYLNNGKVYVEIENGLPVSVSVNVALLNRGRQSLLSIPQSGVPITYASGSVDADGNVVAPAKGTSVIELTRAEVEQYNPAEFISYAVHLNTTGSGPAVRFRTSDNVRVRIWSHLFARVQ